MDDDNEPKKTQSYNSPQPVTDDATDDADGPVLRPLRRRHSDVEIEARSLSLVQVRSKVRHFMSKIRRSREREKRRNEEQEIQVVREVGPGNDLEMRNEEKWKPRESEDERRKMSTDEMGKFKSEEKQEGIPPEPIKSEKKEERRHNESLNRKQAGRTVPVGESAQRNPRRESELKMSEAERGKTGVGKSTSGAGLASMKGTKTTKDEDGELAATGGLGSAGVVSLTTDRNKEQKAKGKDMVGAESEVKAREREATTGLDGGVALEPKNAEENLERENYVRDNSATKRGESPSGMGEAAGETQPGTDVTMDARKEFPEAGKESVVKEDLTEKERIRKRRVDKPKASKDQYHDQAHDLLQRIKNKAAERAAEREKDQTGKAMIAPTRAKFSERKEAPVSSDFRRSEGQVRRETERVSEEPIAIGDRVKSDASQIGDDAAEAKTGDGKETIVVTAAIVTTKSESTPYESTPYDLLSSKSVTTYDMTEISIKGVESVFVPRDVGDIVDVGDKSAMSFETGLVSMDSAMDTDETTSRREYDVIGRNLSSGKKKKSGTLGPKRTASASTSRESSRISWSIEGTNSKEEAHLGDKSWGRRGYKPYGEDGEDAPTPGEVIDTWRQSAFDAKVQRYSIVGRKDSSLSSSGLDARGDTRRKTRIELDPDKEWSQVAMEAARISGDYREFGSNFPPLWIRSKKTYKTHNLALGIARDWERKKSKDFSVYDVLHDAFAGARRFSFVDPTLINEEDSSNGWPSAIEERPTYGKKVGKIFELQDSMKPARQETLQFKLTRMDKCRRYNVETVPYYAKELKDIQCENRRRNKRRQEAEQQRRRMLISRNAMPLRKSLLNPEYKTRMEELAKPVNFNCPRIYIPSPYKTGFTARNQALMERCFRENKVPPEPFRDDWSTKVTAKKKAKRDSCD